MSAMPPKAEVNSEHWRLDLTEFPKPSMRCSGFTRARAQKTEIDKCGLSNVRDGPEASNYAPQRRAVPDSQNFSRRLIVTRLRHFRNTSRKLQSEGAWIWRICRAYARTGYLFGALLWGMECVDLQ
jgi:hypothetical protein